MECHSMWWSGTAREGPQCGLWPEASDPGMARTLAPRRNDLHRHHGPAGEDDLHRAHTVRAPCNVLEHTMGRVFLGSLDTRCSRTAHTRRRR